LPTLIVSLESVFPSGLHHFLSALVEDTDRRLLDEKESRIVGLGNFKQAVSKYVFAQHTVTTANYQM
jgi:hypothetical protein